MRERDRGRISHIGVSNVDTAQLKRALTVTEIAAVQNHYNLAHREHDDVLDLCAAEGIPFVPYFPLRDVTPAAREISARHGATPTQVALAWLLHRSPTTLPIPGTLSIMHVRENLAALDVELDEDDFAALRPRTNPPDRQGPLEPTVARDSPHGSGDPARLRRAFRRPFEISTSMSRSSHRLRSPGEGPRQPRPDLFDGSRQLVVYRFFMDPDMGVYPERGCPGCSMYADQ